MRKLTVIEKIEKRYQSGWDNNWSDFEECEGDFEENCKSAQEESKETSVIIQVSRFYYDLDGNYLGWCPGVIYRFGVVTKL